MDTEETAEGDPLPKASTKKKAPKVEESRSKKEHVNVVFIGHVGKLIFYSKFMAFFIISEIHA